MADANLWSRRVPWREREEADEVSDTVGTAHVRVLVVDDHDLFRSGLRSLLEEEGFLVADSSGGEAAVGRAASFDPDVVVMDMNMPGMSGIEATPLVLQAAPSASVLMLTIATDESRVFEAFRAGASGYLLKDAELSDIVAGVRAAAAGHSAIAPRVAGPLLASVRDQLPRHAEGASTGRVDLSTRELSVLELLTRGCDNAEIARRLFLSQSTVKNHVSRLLEKLGVENRVQAATLAVREGLVELNGP